jgi:Cu+-exporting ATPase
MKETDMTKTIKIGGMSCAHCANRVEKALNALPGITAKVDLAAKTASVTDAGNTSDDAISKAIEGAGYTVER